jgi:hypothetical protein
MRIIRSGLVVAAVAAVALAASSPARAQNYPWCSNFHDGAGTNCGFSTYEQCMATARGTGGYCAPNNMYVAPHGAVSSGQAEHKHRARNSGR